MTPSAPQTAAFAAAYHCRNSTIPAATDIIIADDERVAMVGVEYGFMAWAAGAICLNHLRFTMAAGVALQDVPVGDARACRKHMLLAAL